MERLAQYRQTVKALLNRKAQAMCSGPQPEIETTLTFDEVRDNYFLLRLGWTSQGRLFVPTLYVRLHHGKIWIENDWTEEGLASDLLNCGIPPEDVVLAFHPQELRKYTEFAPG